MYTKLTPNMMVDDVQKTILFYRNVLQFEFVMAVVKDGKEISMELPANTTLAYALMKHGPVEIMFQSQSSLKEDIPAFKSMTMGASASFYFEVSDIEGLYTALCEKSEIIKKLATTWYGMREFYIRDCNGYILGFAQPKS